MDKNKKTCKRVFTWVMVRDDGDVHLCPWNVIPIGNLKENTLEEIWKGEKAESIRQAFLRGEMVGCEEEHCVHCINKDPEMIIYDLDLERQLYEKMPPLPNQLCLAFDLRCNHACPSCRHEMYTPDKRQLDDLKLIYKNIEPYLEKSKLKYFDANGGGEFFCSKELLDMISRYNPTEEDFFMRLECNGVLFKDNWDKVSHLGKWMKVSVTPNSFDRETYRYLAGKDDLEKFEESMRFITQLKDEGKIRQIEMTMVIQDSNFREIPSFVHKCIDVYHADIVILRPIFKWFNITWDELLYKNVLNPCHPYHQEYLEVIKDPICYDPHVKNWGFLDEQEPIEFPTLKMKEFYDGETRFKDSVCKALQDIKQVIDEKLITNKGKLVIYGCGKVGKIVFEELTCGDTAQCISGFMVEDLKWNPKYWMGTKVKTVEENDYDKDRDIVLIALVHSKRVGVKERLLEAGFKNVIEIDDMSKERIK